ncbi:MAG: YbhB/YbcL family Raf kinase inhibitor-like protein [Caldimonas sp.]
MKLQSDSLVDGAPMPPRYAAGRLDDSGSAGFSDNLSPHFAWSEVPPATRSFALVCRDPDVPSRGDDVNQKGREVPAALPRVDFFHWLLVDIPVTTTSLSEGALSAGFTPRGKPGPALGVPGFDGARQGLNDFTGWFAADAAMAGDYFGYDGPFPPWNDSLVHHYVFTLHALDVERAPVHGSFTGAELLKAIAPNTLARASLTATYTLNRRLAGAA